MSEIAQSVLDFIDKIATINSKFPNLMLNDSDFVAKSVKLNMVKMAL